MFSSTNNLHLFPLQHYFPSSPSPYHHLLPPPPPPPLPPHHPELNPTNIVFIGPQDPPSLHGSGGPFLQEEEEEEEEEARMSQNGGKCFSPCGLITKKGSVKKDRHSKIYTAQGLRDRRVRLSIDISRKFFDLQDMLGFDKASKTLDWLLTKSKKAIKELTNNKNLYNFDSESEANQIMLPKSSNKTLPFHDVLAKQSRAKARARARERTKEKIMSKNRQFRSPPPPPPPPPPPSSSSSSIPVFPKGGTTVGGGANLDQENNIIGIMWKPSPMITSSKGECYYNNCNNFYFPPPNWDINIDSFAKPQSGFCSIANMDSLPGFLFLFLLLLFLIIRNQF